MIVLSEITNVAIAVVLCASSTLPLFIIAEK
jgi:hypothetical protein